MLAYYGEKLATTCGKVQRPYPAVRAVRLRRLAVPLGVPEGSTTLDGTGVTVAITDAYASPNIASDAATYAGRNGDRAYAPGQFSQSLPKTLTRVNGGLHQCGENGWYGEETLDVEAVHAMAQGAKIRYYGAASCYDADFLDTFARSTTRTRARSSPTPGTASRRGKGKHDRRVPTGLPAGCRGGDLVHVLLGRRRRRSPCDGAACRPITRPRSGYATAVGGTTTAIDSAGSTAWETGWGTMKYGLSLGGTSWDPLGFLYGSGGGESSLFAQPAYQVGITPAGARGVPDVAMDADVTTGMLDPVRRRPSRRASITTSTGRRRHEPCVAALRRDDGACVPARRRRSGPAQPDHLHMQERVHRRHRPGHDAGNVRVDFTNGLDGSGGLLYSVRDVRPGP